MQKRKSKAVDTFCLSDDCWLICSGSDRCLYKCSRQGQLLQTLLKDKSMAICGIDCNENVVVADWNAKELCIFSQHLGSVVSICDLRQRPYDAVFDCHDYVWLAVAKDEDEERTYEILKCSG